MSVWVSVRVSLSLSVPPFVGCLVRQGRIEKARVCLSVSIFVHVIACLYVCRTSCHADFDDDDDDTSLVCATACCQYAEHLNRLVCAVDKQLFAHKSISNIRMAVAAARATKDVYWNAPWAARYNTWLLIQLTPEDIVFSSLCC